MGRESTHRFGLVHSRARALRLPRRRRLGRLARAAAAPFRLLVPRGVGGGVGGRGGRLAARDDHDGLAVRAPAPRARRAHAELVARRDAEVALAARACEDELRRCRPLLKVAPALAPLQLEGRRTLVRHRVPLERDRRVRARAEAQSRRLGRRLRSFLRAAAAAAAVCAPAGRQRARARGGQVPSGSHDPIALDW